MVRKKISKDEAEAVALDILDGRDIYELSVYIYGNRRAALNGLVESKMFDVTVKKGNVAEVIKNLFYRD